MRGCPTEVGERFGRWLVVGATRLRREFATVICDCGTQKKVLASSLVNGSSLSCGCLHREKFRNRPRHGHSVGGASPTFVSWQAMRARCSNPKHHNFKNYGGRGIKVCERWMKFENFLADMGERPSGLTIERKDNDGDYTPTNCVWATPAQQMRNRRSTRLNEFAAEEIRVLISDGVSQRRIAMAYGIDQAMVSRIMSGKAWRHIS
jgi:hypothetical protein